MNIQETVRLLQQQDDILILTHARPDGDTLGCAAALCASLRKAGKTAFALSNSGTTETYLDYIQPYYAPAGFAPRFVVSVDIAALQLLTGIGSTLPSTIIPRKNSSPGRPASMTAGLPVGKSFMRSAGRFRQSMKPSLCLSMWPFPPTRAVLSTAIPHPTHTGWQQS